MSKNQETKELEVKNQGALVIDGVDLSQAWEGDDDIFESKDARIPRALLMQSTSELVGQRKAATGDVVNSFTGEKIGSEEKPLKFAPIHTFKTWVVSEKSATAPNAKFEYKLTEAYVPGVERPREEVIGDVIRQHMETINVFCLLESDLENPAALPYLLAFRSTSLNCGKDILTQKRMMRNTNVAFQSALFTVTPTYTKNDKGQFFIFKLTKFEKNPNFAKSAGMIKGWYETVKAGAIKVDDESVDSEVSNSEAPLTGEAKAERF